MHVPTDTQRFKRVGRQTKWKKNLFSAIQQHVFKYKAFILIHFSIGINLMAL